MACFGKNKAKKDGHHYYCKGCVKELSVNNKEQVKDNYKQWSNENAAHIKAYQKQYRKDNRDQLNAYQRSRPPERKLRANTSDTKKSKEKERRNTPEYKSQRSTYIQKKYREDMQFRLKKLFEAELNALLFKNDATIKSQSKIGCTIPEFKEYLQSKFLPTMTWENYGIVWQIDRIKPFCSFDLTDEAQQKQCFHYTNTQPLFVTSRVIDGIFYLGNMNKNMF